MARTSAIVSVYAYGNVCDIRKINTIIKQYVLKVIYDVAYAFGYIYEGKGIEMPG